MLCAFHAGISTSSDPVRHGVRPPLIESTGT